MPIISTGSSVAWCLDLDLRLSQNAILKATANAPTHINPTA